MLSHSAFSRRSLLLTTLADLTNRCVSFFSLPCAATHFTSFKRQSQPSRKCFSLAPTPKYIHSIARTSIHSLDQSFCSRAQDVSTELPPTEVCFYSFLLILNISSPFQDPQRILSRFRVLRPMTQDRWLFGSIFLPPRCSLKSLRL